MERWTIKDARALIGTGVEWAQRGLSPDLEMLVLGHEKNPRLAALSESLKELNLTGETVVFLRKKGAYYGDPVGVPVVAGYESDEHPYWFTIGLYLPSSQDLINFGDWETVQNLVNEGVGNFYLKFREQGKPLNCMDSLLVVNKDMISVWKEKGLFFNQSKNEVMGGHREKRIVLEELEHGRKFMREEYLPAMFSALQVMREMRLNPVELMASGSTPSGVLSIHNGRFVSVNFQKLISTDHSQELVGFIRERDHWICQHPDGVDLFGGTQFGVDDLFFLSEDVSRFREEGDPMIDYMGMDTVGVDELEDPHGLECGKDLKGRFDEIPFNLKRLSPESTHAHLHHIFPRGAAYKALLTAFLIDDSIQNWSVRDLALLLRGVKAKKLVSDYYHGLFKDRRKVYKTLANHILQIDRVVNSPYNLVTLCHRDHDLIHPDMEYAYHIAGFLRELTVKNINLDRKTMENVIAGNYVNQEMNYREIMRGLKLGRFLVTAVGRPYWMVSTADKLLDVARVSTDRWISAVKDQEINDLLEKGQGKNKAERDLLAREIEVIKNSNGELYLPFINRDTQKLESFKKKMGLQYI